MTLQRALMGILLVIGPAQQATAGFIPVIDGFYQYVEELNTYSSTPSGETGAWFYGTSPLVAETVSGSAGPAAGYARTTVGTGTTGPTTEARSEAVYHNILGLDYYYQVVGVAGIEYDLQLVKLHPDAPDDLVIPLRYTSTMTGGITGRLTIEDLNTGEQLASEMNPGTDDQPYLIDSSISVQLGHTLRAWIYAGQPLYTNSGPLPPVQVTGPVFEIDPNFMVEFIDNADGSVRYERAVDLYSLAYPAAIGFAGDFNTVTPLTDGCLPDPSILGPDGTQSVTGGETVTCQAIDPSGFRSYGPGVQDPLGDLDNMTIVITGGAIVRTDADDTETIGILGNDNVIYNEGTILSTGYRADAISFAEGNGNSVENHGAIDATGMESHAVHTIGDGVEVYSTGAISSSGDYAAAIFLEGDVVSVLNEGVITTDGLASSAVVLEGDDALALNDGEIQTSADQSAGLVIEGNNGTLENSGSIGTQGVFSAGMVMLALGSEGVENSGTITTLGDDAMGILALGSGHTIDNIDPGTGNRIWTTGARAHGIALGLQEAVLPPGVIIPEEALDPVIDGVINNTGLITTEGEEADAIHALAGNLPVTNSGELSTLGREAHAISIVGASASIENTGELSTAGTGAYGIFVDGNDAVINHGNQADAGSIATAQLGAKGIFVTGDRASINVGGGAAMATIMTGGENADGILIDGTGSKVSNEGHITVQGNNSFGITAFGEGGNFDNAGTISGGLSPISTGNRGFDINGAGNTVLNSGIININSNAGIGLFVFGDSAIVSNNNQNAEIRVAGSNATGISVSSDAPVIVNEGLIQASGQDARGITATAGSGAIFQITSGGSIDVDGTGALGMLLSTSSLWGAGTAGALAPSCNVINDGTSKLVNCGSIDFQSSPNGGGMIAIDIVDSTVENQGRIDGSGLGARGISVHTGMAGGGDGNALVANVDRITVAGENAAGVEVFGHSNVVLQGNGSIAIPTDPFEYVTDLQSVDGYSLFPNAEQLANEFSRDVPAGTLIPVAQISVTGINAIGLSVEGDGNRIGQLYSGQTDQTSIIARGAGAIGVKLSGNNNMFVNGGEVIADGVGIQGGQGDDSVTNQWLVEGGIDLAGGADRLIVDSASEIGGTVNGGDGQDELIFFVGGDLGGPFDKVIDANQYENFEQASKIGIGRLLVLNELRVDVLTIHNGTLDTAGSTRLVTAGNSIHVMEDGQLTGSGTAVGRLQMEGGTLAPGNGIGSLYVEGDLILDSGILEFEVNSPLDTDRLFVSGDVSLNQGLVDVILGFTPAPEDVLELLVIQGTLGIAEDFGGIRGFAAAGSGVALGTLFMVNLGGELFTGTVTSVVPIPASILLFISGLLGLTVISIRKKAV